MFQMERVNTVRVLVIPLLPTMTNEHMAITPVTFTAGLEGGILTNHHQPCGCHVGDTSPLVLVGTVTFV